MSDEKKVAIQILEPATSCYECGGSVEDIDPDHWVWVTEEEYRTLRAYFDDPFGHGRAWGETDLGVLISHGTKEDTETKIESIL